MTARKKWAVERNLMIWGVGSKQAAYQRVRRYAQLRLEGLVAETHVSVWVDEGRGWKLYERIDLRDLPGGES